MQSFSRRKSITKPMLDPKSQPDHNSSPAKDYAETTLLHQSNENRVDRSSSSSDDDILQFRPNNHQELDDSGAISPPLWKNIPSTNQSPSPSHPLLSHHRLSPSSRRKAIASGQRELMEMLKNMPESSYELSLQDLVEHHLHKVEISDTQRPQAQNTGKESKDLKKRAVFGKAKGYRGFEEKGLFLKMGFPLNLQPKKNKRIVDGNNSNGTASPKSERDWWKKKSTGSSDSETSRTSSTSGSGGRSSIRRSYGGGSSSGGSQRESQGILTGCLQLFQSRRRSKSVE